MMRGPRPTPMTARWPVPRWWDLPDHARAQLAAAHFNGRGFIFDAQHDDARLTVLVLYVKLSGLGLWPFVENDPSHPIKDGKIHFQCRLESVLKGTLLARPDFTDPEPSMSTWSSREKRSSGSLHLKRWAGCSAHSQCPGFIEAHIDPSGALLSDAAWFFPPLQLGQVIAHGLSRDGFKDVHSLRAMLLGQGWDPATLLGKQAMARWRR